MYFEGGKGHFVKVIQLIWMNQIELNTALGISQWSSSAESPHPGPQGNFNLNPNHSVIVDKLINILID